MSNKFHNPYHFVPVKPRTDAQKEHDLLVAGVERNVDWDGHGHDRYAQGRQSGRLVCKLTTETPIFIGAEQVKGEPNDVQPFKIGAEPAIPASSLRGLLSSLAEAASNSALRVLHRERPLSYRYTMKENMSAIGMVLVETDENNKTKYFLKPLALPSLDKRNSGDYDYPQRFAGNPCNYAPMFRHFATAPLKVFIDVSNQTSFNIQKPQYFYLKQEPIPFGPDKTYLPNHRELRFSSKDPGGRTAIGQNWDRKLLGEEEWRKLPEIERNQHLRGILRVMGSRRDRPDFPSGKSHEHFIPYPAAVESSSTKFLIEDAAVKRFHALAEERGEDSGGKHPYEPIGTRPDRNGKSLRLQHGDILYFVANANGTEVSEISYSSIWRGYAGTIEDYFRKVDPELLPFTDARTRVTPTDLLFGFVQEGSNKDARANAFKGKVQVSFGRLTEGQKDFQDPRQVILKILASPKPPSPALYFKPAHKPEGGYIAKSVLAKPDNQAIPQGRKLYLHHRIQEKEQPWETGNKENMNQKNRIQPLRSGLEFTFHIDFDNLSAWELGLLCYAVRPMEAFRHKIGMGKPLGLGTVRIDPVELKLVDRQKRYSPQGLAAERFQTETPACDEWRKIFTGGMDGDIKNALRLLGNPEFVTCPVHTPQKAGLNAETDTFKWFVANDSHKIKDESKRLFLKPLRDKLNLLEPLDTPAEADDSGGGRFQGGRGPNDRPGGNRPGGGFNNGGRR